MFGGAFSIWHLLLVLLVVIVLFGGRGKLSSVMGDAAKGIRAFRDGLKDDSADAEKSGGKLPRTDAEKEDLRN